MLKFISYLYIYLYIYKYGTNLCFLIRSFGTEPLNH